MHALYREIILCRNGHTCMLRDNTGERRRMAREKSSRSKTQTLSLRLDPKTRFVLEFVSRIRGQSITTVVERAIKEASSEVSVGPTWDERGNPQEPNTWQDFWDPDEGVRTLKLLANSAYPTTFEEDELRAFTLAHHEFFYTNDRGHTPNKAQTNVLWSKIDKYLELWRETKATDYWACGKLMVQHLSAAGLSHPNWPRSPTSPSRDFSQDLDDEVPF